MTDPSPIQRSVRRFLRLAPLAAVVATAACATPQEQTYETRLAEARTAPDLCQSDRFHVLVAKAWEKAHEAGGADVEDASPNPNTPAPAIQVQASSAMPDVSFPPYSQRACRMTVQSGTAAPETGFFTVAYFMHNGKVDTSVPLWDSDKEVSDYYNEL
ncbi:hypothetical protein NBRC3280_0760 [Acetobacter pasteurianus NBRC 3280]|nr:hypothetical protein [Acetobacter pasteurianus]GCD58260.1 hypothetical protein NBRC3277_0835 [Acetobacter pasteurianus NBRC 3277]GCD61749.1 hypothetical protein NBRC3278_0842 [Acetobacter pasteurianus NBRC 3278]GCD68125.1 hypothetical protein NBRC3280_0760 [Acetobacter pasteurianus NBRC 3280]